MMSQRTTDLNIPQPVLDDYNRHFNNRTYRAFSDRLHRFAAADPTFGEVFIDTALNLLIDASLERAGAAFYHGAEQSLLVHLRPAPSDLVPLALVHLANFGPTPDPAPVSSKTASAQITSAREYAERPSARPPAAKTRVACGSPSWASAAPHPAGGERHPVESHDSYPLEN
jgi:hypothetical protein